MAPDDARARQDERAALQHAADPAEPVRTRHVSGWAPKPTLDTSIIVDVDEDWEPQERVIASEPTLITPGALIESLREASRLESAADPLTTRESQPPYVLVSQALETRDEEDTTIFVLHEDAQTRPRRLLKAATIGSTVLLATILALRADAPKTSVTPQKAKTETASPTPSKQPAPSPTVVQLQPEPEDTEPGAVVSAPSLSLSAQADPKLDIERKWLRALERGEARLAAHEYGAAALSFERAIQHYPDDPRAYAGLAEAQVQQGKWSEATRAYQDAIARSPDDAALRAGLARANEQSATEEDDQGPGLRAAELDTGASE